MEFMGRVDGLLELEASHHWVEFTAPITKQLFQISIVPPKAAQKSTKVASRLQVKIGINRNREAI